MNVSASPPSPRDSAGAAGHRRRPQPAGVSEAAGDAPAAEPSLLEMLTPEERTFFAQQTALGPLTYGAGGAAAARTGRRASAWT